MIAALVTLDLHIAAATSLKGKRAVVKALIAALRRELNCSVVEVDHQDLWQRSVLGIAIAAGSEVGARKVAQQVEKIVHRDPRVELLTVHIEIVEPEL
jgi:uncharacterized protein